MSPYIEKAEQITLPVAILRGTVAFPSVPINFEPGDDATDASVKTAAAGSPFLFLVSPCEPVADRNVPTENQLYRIGTVAKIKQMLHTPEGSTRVVCEGFARAVVSEYRIRENRIEADVICKTVSMPDRGGVRGEACIHQLLDALQDNLKLLPTGTADLLNAARLIDNPGQLADFIAANILVRTQDKQTVLECFDPLARTEILLLILLQESEIMLEEAKIHRRVNDRLNRNQREYYLREQIKVIEEELGEGGSDVEEYSERIRKANLPKEVAAKLRREVDRLDKTPYGSAESTVILNYLDTCLEIPWNKATKDRINIQTVEKVLNADHNGLEKVKERIVEYIAAKQMNPELRGQMLCLVGPPGVGKTSIAASVARALNRKYVRISLGGVRDEADIRGHRKTYIGAMPGRIISALTQAGVKNPLILLDEIDKLTRDAHGDPTSALLEVLDGEQNKSFRDHFVELPFDLSDCMFIATANSLENIPRPLMDRMEIIELSIYTRREKLAIAKDHLIQKQLARHGLSRKTLKFTDGAILEIIDFYTREAGVRNLERTIASLCRKVDRRLLTDEKKSYVIDAKDVESYLGVRKYLPETVGMEDHIGVVNGLAYTELGGTLLQVEVAVLEGTGKIETTGSLGDVMKESAKIAVSYVRSIAERYSIPTDFYKTKDIHIHFPEGATPKDGPSAGVTMVTALVSALTGRPVRHDVAMTGEISLCGRVLPIGGLKEKTMAAYTAGAATVLIPKENLRDLEKIDSMARENLRFVPCERAEEVLAEALLPAASVLPEKKEKERTAPLFVPTQPTPAGVRI